MNRLEDINVKYWELLFNSSDIGHKGLKDYSAKCPICGDSKKRQNLKRCHLFTKESWDHDKVHCFNCGWKGNMFSLLETVAPHLYTSYKNEKRATAFNSLVQSKQQPEPEKKIEIDTSFAEKIRAVPPKIFDLPSQFTIIETDDIFYQYLKTRNMTDKQIKMFRKCTSSIRYNGQDILLKDYIILPLWYGDKVYGFQARSVKSKLFYTFVPEENHGYKVWNWFNVEINKPIYVFESYFDALSSGLDNIVAQLGATLSVERLAETEEVIFVLDNQFVDPTARKESIKYAQAGHKVMVWPKGIKQKDFNEILKDGGKPEQIKKFIERNVDDGVTAVVKLTL